MSKTKKFKMEVNMLDTIVVSSKISESEFNKQLKSLKEQVAKTHEDPNAEETYVATDKESNMDFEHFYLYQYSATLGTTDIRLVSIICKPGYRFKD